LRRATVGGAREAGANGLYLGYRKQQEKGDSSRENKRVFGGFIEVGVTSAMICKEAGSEGFEPNQGIMSSAITLIQQSSYVCANCIYQYLRGFRALPAREVQAGFGSACAGQRLQAFLTSVLSRYKSI
jgi:hypothetical protein